MVWQHSKTLLFVVLVSLFQLQPVVAGQKINKCRDAKGVWHYGDFAARACEKGSLQRIDSSGVEISIDHGPSAAEKKRQKLRQQALRRLRRQQLEQQKKDNHLLRLYASEQAVIDAREKHLQTIDQEIAANKSLSAALVQERDNLQNRLLSSQGKKEKQRLQQLLANYDQQIVAYQQVEQKARQRRLDIQAKYDRDLVDFRDLLRRQARQSEQSAQ